MKMKKAFSMVITVVCLTAISYVTALSANAAQEHRWDEGTITTAPTCTSQGEKTFTCTDCGATRTEIIEETGIHEYDGGSITKEPNCLENGEKIFFCQYDCGSYYTQEIPALGHSYDDGIITKKPTCTEKGVKTFTCQNKILTYDCGDQYTQEIPATGHRFDNGKITKSPTETETGIRTYTCTQCGETDTESIPMLQIQKTSNDTSKTYNNTENNSNNSQVSNSTVDIPKTGNSFGSIVMFAVISLISVIIIFVSKRKFI